MKKVLITGAAGLVGSMLRRYWGSRYALRLADIKPVDGLQDHEEFVRLDITQLDDFTRACQGIDTVVHLAADRSPRADFYQTLLDLNIIGGYNGFEAARQASCRRLVFASSVNALLGYRHKVKAEWDAPVFPQNVYGATKCWGEALARVYADQHHLSCICVRLSAPSFDQAGDWDPDVPNDLISPRDTAQLFGLCVDAESLDFAIVHGSSRHRNEWMGLDHTCQILGYEPENGTAFSPPKDPND
jgi:UDP-glucose 4-epimerase